MLRSYIATSNKDACNGLPGNSLKSSLRNPYVYVKALP